MFNGSGVYISVDTGVGQKILASAAEKLIISWDRMISYLIQIFEIE